MRKDWPDRAEGRRILRAEGVDPSTTGCTNTLLLVMPSTYSALGHPSGSPLPVIVTTHP